MATQPPDEDVHMVEVAPGLSVPTTEQYNISSPPVPRAAATAAAAPDASAAGEDADATMHGDGEEEVDDDALIEAAFKETGLEAPLRSPAMKSSAAASAQQMDVGDDEDGDTDDEDLLNPFSAAAIAAAAKAVKPPVEGETYVSETGEVLRRRAKKKKVVVELSEEEKAAELQAKKEATERAENLLKDLLKKADEVLRRTMMGGGQLATAAATKQKKGKKDEGPRRKTEKEEDDELLDDLEEDTLPNGAVQLRAQPSIVTGQMRAYQLEGLQWMIKLYHAGVSGILADEMGLGKTLQSISLLAYLRHYQKVNGPHLVLVPLSTLGNWHREFERWCPSIRCFKFHGTREERAKMVADGMLQPENWDVLLTSYEMSIREKASVSKVKWNFIVIDEAHRLKNEGSLLSQIVRIFSSRNRLLLTGTPLQNNLHELWALLSFLMPDIFNSGADFDSMFSASEVDPDVSAKLLEQLHKILRPFMLRRLKSQVATDLPPKKETLLFVGMSELQAKLYRGVLERDIDAVLGRVKEKSRLMNIIMQLRKCSNHPYLFEGVEDRSLPAYGDHLIFNSGKMVVVDKLLARFHAKGSRVLIFSQMTRTLDLLEDYCTYRQYQYCRIDGSTLQDDREVSMRDFNADNSEKFVFLLSTRAGGLGINLNTADIVILFDSDWNPQMDLQAMDRAHRIGQKKPVFVYRLITENTIEEKILERAEVKLRLDAMVIQQGRAAPKQQGKGAGGMSADDVSSMIRFGADRIFRQTGSSITDADIDAILLAGEQRTQELNSKLGKHVGALDFSLDGAPAMMLPDENDQGLPMDELERTMMTNLTDSVGKRSRQVKTYDINSTFRDQMANGQEKKSHLPKPYRIPRLPDYQLWQSKRIMELAEQEKSWYDAHAFDTSVPAIRGGLNIAEDAELQRLLQDGFPDWQWADYVAFINACKRYGGKMSAFEKVYQSMEGRGKSREAVAQYHAAFFERAPHLPGFKSALEKIARGEARAKKFAELEDLLERLLAAYPQRADVMERLPIHYAPLLKGRGFSLSEDRFLLYWCRLLGYGEWSKLRSQIRKDAEFRFDYFLKSRSCAELNRRVDALLRSMQKEEAKQQSRRASRKGIAATTTAAGSASASAHRPDPSSTPLPLSRELFATSGGSRPLSTQVSPSPSPVMFHARQPAAPLSSSGSLADDAIPSAADEDRPLGVKRRSLLHADHDDEGEHDEHAQEADGDVDMPQVEDPAEDLPLVHRQKVLKAMQRLEASRSNF